MTSKGKGKLCKKAHNWPSLETLKNLVKKEESCIALPPKEAQAKKAHNWPTLETLKNLVKNEKSGLALPPKEFQALEENEKLDKKPLKIIEHDSNSHSATTVSESNPGDIEKNGNHQLQVILFSLEGFLCVEKLTGKTLFALQVSSVP